MKSLITAVVALAFVVVSCKKDVQSTSNNTDNLTTADSTNTNSTPSTTDNATAVSPSTSDTANSQTRDSTMSVPNK